MPSSVVRRYHAECAHWLPGVAESHKCHRLHGHNYEFDVEVTGAIDDKSGFILDFADLDDIVNPIIKRIDHRTLNDIHGLENPTAELIGHWFLKHISEALASQPRELGHVTRVVVWETKECSAHATPSA